MTSNAVAEIWQGLCSRYTDQPALLGFYTIQTVQWISFWVPATALLSLDLMFPAWSNRHKIQSERLQPTPAQIKHCISHVFVNSVAGAAITFTLGWATAFQRPIFVVSNVLPTPQELVKDISFAMLAREILFYTSHRLLHHPRIYRRIHKQHHLFIAPMSFAAQYAHPVEHVVANMLPITLPLALWGSHILTFAVYLSWALIETSCAHSGYDFFTWPILGTMHDLHHEKFNVNFGGMGWLDWACGTGRWHRLSPPIAPSPLSSASFSSTSPLTGRVDPRIADRNPNGSLNGIIDSKIKKTM